MALPLVGNTSPPLRFTTAFLLPMDSGAGSGADDAVMKEHLETFPRHSHAVIQHFFGWPNTEGSWLESSAEAHRMSQHRWLIAPTDMLMAIVEA